MKKTFSVVAFCSLLAWTVLAGGQTFEINGQPSSTASAPGKAKAGKKSPASAETAGIGWGSSIEVGRLSRAAEGALRKGNYAAAADYAQRAANSAPQNAELWFLAGYASRVAGRHQAALEAYQRGLQIKPNSVEGLSGMAQTYDRMGRTDEAKRLLLKVIAANPKRPNELAMAGELFIKTGDLQQGINLLQRAEALRPMLHQEVMLASAYMRLGQPARAKQLLESAKRRSPRNPALFRAIANYYRETKDYKSAIATLRSMPNKTPDAWADLGYSYQLDGDKSGAADAYAAAADGDPKRITYQLSAAETQIANGKADKGRAFLQRAEALDRNHYRLHSIRGQLARQEGRLDDAIREYNQSIANLPEGVPEGVLFPILLRLNLSELYRVTGNDAAAQQQVAAAEQQINRLNVQGPVRAEYFRVRASIATQKNDLAAAEADLKQAIAIDRKNVNIVLQYANLLWKMQRKEEARELYAGILKGDTNNRNALEALGYLARDVGDHKTAEQFFNRMAAAYPKDYVPYLALGDMFAALRDFPRALANYEKAFKLNASVAPVVAGGANAAIESHQFQLAGHWLDRAAGPMNDDARVMRERERYLFHTGKYLESARLGYKVLERLPKDREGSVYLAYDLYNLGRYDDVLALVNRYENILQKEPNFPLLAGHVHQRAQLLNEAVEDYTRALERDPKMAEAYVNRGYVLNDLQNAAQASEDFEVALKLKPGNGVAHLGLAFSSLQLHQPKRALDNVEPAEQALGESGATHLIRASAYRQQRLLDKAEKSYRAALKYAPDDLSLHVALAETLSNMRRYGQAIVALNDALALAPDEPLLYARLAHAHAELHHRDQTLRYVQEAERQGSDRSAVLLATGQALLMLGDREAALDRFSRALDAPDANRVEARLAFARLMVSQGKWDDARQQISLAFAEARIGEASPVTSENLIQAANMFLAMHDFDLAQRYFQRAKALGAADEVIALGLANTHLAQGDGTRAEAELASLGGSPELRQNYDYMLTQANLYRQRHEYRNALSAFARANQLAGNDDVAQRALHEVAGHEGMPLNSRWSVLSDFSVSPLFEDETIYIQDAQLFGVANDKSLLPPPRSSTEVQWTNAFRMHQPSLPVISGFFQLRNARGRISVPSQNVITDRDTFDYNFNGALNPVLRVGRGTIDFNTGLQFTLRRDRQSPREMNQNLFRQFVHMSTSAFGNWLAIRGSAFHETGPFTARNLHSRELGAHLEFQVGRPWGRNAMITGYSVRDLLFRPLVREYFSTSTYIGWQRKFGENLRVAALAEYVRGWRVQELNFALAQVLRPAAEFDYRINKSWRFNGSVRFSRANGGLHDYDNMQSGFLISYVKPLRRMWDDGGGEVPVEYPIRFSFGIQQQTFMNFPGRGQATFSPVVRLTLF